MLRCLLLALAAGALDAAAVRGTVVDDQSGKPLARTLVVVAPVAGGAGKPISARTNPYGAFEFAQLAAGAYLVSASHTGYVTAHYGQKEWKSAGVPVVLDAAATASLNIRLKHFGAISGEVLDENEVGIPDHQVVAYRNTRPPQLAAKAVTDDRGVYRLFGLEPGTYLVRTVAKQLEEGGYLPTFSRETAAVDQAQTVEVNLDETTDRVNVKPFPGRLLELAGRVVISPPRAVTLTLVSDAGRQTVTTTGSFRFDPVAPGQYEIFASIQPDSRYGIPAVYLPLSMGFDQRDLRVVLTRFLPTEFVFESNGQSLDPAGFQVLARRKDLAGEDPPQRLRLTNGRATLAPGRWDVSLEPAPAWYVTGVSGPAAPGAERGRPDGWNEILAGTGSEPVRFLLSSSPGAVHGTVTSSGDPVPGVPVFLEPDEPEARTRLTDVRTARTDLKGHYRFAGLAPGAYRLLATFEYEKPDPAVMRLPAARALKLDEGQDAAQDLELYVIR